MNLSLDSTAAFLYTSNCCSSVGMETPSRKKNSVLKRPTPSAPKDIALEQSLSPPMLAARQTLEPSPVSVALSMYLFNSSFLSAYIRLFFSYIFRVFPEGFKNTSPYSPSIITGSLSFTLEHIPFKLRTAGISRALARIAA